MAVLNTAEARTGAGVAAVAEPCSGIPADRMAFIRQVLDRVGDKWSLLIIAVLKGGPVRYTDLHRLIPGISQRMLTLNLRQLHEDGLITRTSHPEVPPRVEYALTPLGDGLRDIAVQLIGWAADHHDEIQGHRQAAASVDPGPHDASRIHLDARHAGATGCAPRSPS